MKSTYLEALKRRFGMSLSLYQMWVNVEDGYFEYAMYWHFEYLAARDEYTKIMDNLHWQERNKLSDVYMITDGLLSEFRG